MKRRPSLFSVAVQTLAVLLAVAYLIPVYMTLNTSLKSPAEINLPTAWQLPSELNWASYVTAWTRFAIHQEQPHLAVAATLISAGMGFNGHVLCKYPFPAPPWCCR